MIYDMKHVLNGINGTLDIEEEKLNWGHGNRNYPKLNWDFFLMEKHQQAVS